MSNNPERRIVVVIDEAHLLEKEMMEEVRILLNDQMDSISPVSLILSGQSEIRDRLEMKAYAAINQRIDIRCKLHPLDRVVTHQFIEHQLSIVGAKRRIFSEIAMDEVYNFSGGYPRKICKLCLASLICAASRKETTIDDQMVKDVIESEMS
jgi:type II secretory pathway predicted ATPase ExeA